MTASRAGPPGASSPWCALEALDTLQVNHMVTREQPKIVVFDCDGVLVDAVSSWRTLHDSFGTDNAVNLTVSYAGDQRR